MIRSFGIENGGLGWETPQVEWIHITVFIMFFFIKLVFIFLFGSTKWIQNRSNGKNWRLSLMPFCRRSTQIAQIRNVPFLCTTCAQRLNGVSKKLEKIKIEHQIGHKVCMFYNDCVL